MGVRRLTRIQSGRVIGLQKVGRSPNVWRRSHTKLYVESKTKATQELNTVLFNHRRLCHCYESLPLVAAAFAMNHENAN